MSKECIHFFGPLCVYTHIHTHTYWAQTNEEINVGYVFLFLLSSFLLHSVWCVSRKNDCEYKRQRAV